MTDNLRDTIGAKEVSPRGLYTLAAHEGIVPAPYRDSVGVWTYGIGHTKAAGDPDPQEMPRGMPKNIDMAIVEVFKVFSKDIQKYTSDVLEVFDGVNLSQEELDGLVSFHYNTGAIAKATFTGFLRTDPLEARQRFMQWRKPPEIVPRRTEEAELIFEGKYPGKNVTVWSADDFGKVVWKPVKTLDFSDFMEYMKPHEAKKFVTVEMTKEDFDLFKNLTRLYFKP